MAPNETTNVLITGVSRGIGETIARFFLANGWVVHGISRSEPRIKDSRLVWHRADVGNTDELRRVLGELPGPFDCVVENAGMLGPIGRSLEIPMDGWRTTFDVNFFAPLTITRGILAKTNPNACFIFLSGGGAVTPVSGVGPYALSKLAIVKLVEQLSIEEDRFRFYAMAPGAVDTEIFREHHARSGGAVPRFTTADEIEALVAKLLADTERHLNGKLVHVRDDIHKLLSVPDAGHVRRVEAR